VRAGEGRAVLVLALGIAGGCSDRVEVGYDLSSGGAGSPAAGGGTASGGSGALANAGSGGSDSSAGASPCEPVACRGKVYECGNCGDDDGDSLSDALDPECLGPCDDSEEVFASPSPGGTSCRLDCAFDRDAGLGNDRCDWDLRCDPHSPGSGISCESTAETLAAASCVETASTQPEACVDACAPLTPNGCDCFGCCELPARSGRFVWIGSTDSANACSGERLDDPVSCPPCTPVPACENSCDVCEVCVGGAGASSACAAPDEPACGSGTPPCGPGAACPSNRYCVTGCCIVVPS
jgi:hypothetical protein